MSQTEVSDFSAVPLVVDLDGTLTPSDTLVESVVALLRHRPWALPLLVLWLLGGRARFKQKVAEAAAFSPRTLPWREDLLDWLKAEKSAGRRIVLATAAHDSIAQAVSQQLGLFDQVLATNSSVNLKGPAKLAAIREQVGSSFSYAGDSKADLPIWAAARSAVLAGASGAVAREVRANSRVEREFTNPRADWRTWLRAMRVHQWVKNSLLFVPLLTALSPAVVPKLVPVLIGFIAFSLAASGTYLMNDLWDLENDRQHPRKKLRPFASAALSPGSGVLMAGALLLAGLSAAWTVSLPFAGMLVGYVVLTTAYSWSLKHYVLIDVLMLAMLYTFRVLAGSVASGIVVTSWLLAFSVFTFFSLALVKRCAELVSLQQAGRAGVRGRDYQTGDLIVLWPLGIGSSLASIVVFGLYIGSANAGTQYARTEILWLVGVGLLYWNSRMWIKTARGEMHDDPIVFAAKDFGSRVTVASMVLLTVVAHLLG